MQKGGGGFHTLPPSTYPSLQQGRDNTKRGGGSTAPPPLRAQRSFDLAHPGPWSGQANVDTPLLVSVRLLRAFRNPPDRLYD